MAFDPKYYEWSDKDAAKTFAAARANLRIRNRAKKGKFYMTYKELRDILAEITDPALLDERVQVTLPNAPNGTQEIGFLETIVMLEGKPNPITRLCEIQTWKDGKEVGAQSYGLPDDQPPPPPKSKPSSQRASQR